MTRCRCFSPPRPAVLLALACSLGPAAVLAGSADPAADPSRFRVVAALAEKATSNDGRFAVLAELSHAPEASTVDRRFNLKVVNVPAVGCDPLGPDIFSDGFESP